MDDRRDLCVTGITEIAITLSTSAFNRDESAKPTIANLPLSRVQLAEFLICNRDLVLARIRRKLGRINSVRAVSDTNDLFSSLAFRPDRLDERDLLRAATDSQLWALILKSAHNLMLEKSREAGSLRRLAAAYSNRLSRTASEINDSIDNEDAANRVQSLLSRLRSETDRTLLIFKLNGVPNRSIAAGLGLREAAVRQRWSRICRGLRKSRAH